MIHYAVTKSTQLRIAECLAQLAKGGVTVNTMLLAPTRCNWIGDFLKSVASDPVLQHKMIEENFFWLYQSLSLIQRMFEPDEIAAAVTYLADPLAAATTGCTFGADGERDRADHRLICARYY